MACQRIPDSHGTLLHKSRANSTLQLSHEEGITSNAKNSLPLCTKMPSTLLSMGIISFFDFWAFGRLTAPLDEPLLESLKRSLWFQRGLSFSGGGSCSPFGVEMRCLSSTEKSR